MDYYQILGIERDASLADIKNAYKKSTNHLLPSLIKDPKNEEFHKRAQLLDEAFDTLSCYVTRYLYDLGINNAHLEKDFKKELQKYNRKHNKTDLKHDEQPLFDIWLIKYKKAYGLIKEIFGQMGDPVGQSLTLKK